MELSEFLTKLESGRLPEFNISDHRYRCTEKHSAGRFSDRGMFVRRTILGTDADTRLMRLYAYKTGHFSMQFATGWSAEIGDCSDPPEAKTPIEQFKSVTCIIRGKKGFGEVLSKIFSKSALKDKIKLPAGTGAENTKVIVKLTLDEVFQCYRLLGKAKKLGILV